MVSKQLYESLLAKGRLKELNDLLSSSESVPTVEAVADEKPSVKKKVSRTSKRSRVSEKKQ